jgi:hypothetical protein
MSLTMSNAVPWMHFSFIPEQYVDRPAALKAFSQTVKGALRQDSGPSFNHVQLMLMLLELAKNTFDHSHGVGILNLQLPSPSVPLFVSYLDTDAAFDWNTSAQFGHSSKAGNGVNYGLGLGIVRQGCAAAGLALTVERLESGTEFRFQQSGL